jgi:3-dehydroquinate synthase
VRVLEIHGQTGTSRILVGEPLGNLPLHMPPGRAVFITDANVRRLHPSVFEGRDTIEIPPGEPSKSLETAALVYRRLVGLETDRSTFVVAVGGGVVCDLAGFVASTFLRGLAFGYAATTLLAQADASVGGKTGVNFDGAKNMIGVFQQPRFVVCDPAVLSTLPRREVLSGMAEIVKHAAIGSPPLFANLERRSGEALELHGEILEDLVYQSVAVKVAVVERDEKEAGERRKLNFGHTLGHALEARLGLSHAELSVRKGLLPDREAGRLRKLLREIGLPTKVSFDGDAILDAVRKDKKREGGRIRFVFLRGIGEPAVEDIDIRVLEEFIHDLR